jgi:Transposase DDE domain
MIFAESLPFAKSFFAPLSLPASTLTLLTRFLVACVHSLRSAAQAAQAIRFDPCHRAQLVRFLARQGWAKDWATLTQVADLLLDACRHEQGDWLFLLDQTTHTTRGRQAQNTFSCRNTKKRSKYSQRQQKKTPPRRHHLFIFGLLISPQTGTRLPCVRPYYTKDYCQQRAAQAKPGQAVPIFRTQAEIAAELIRGVRVPPQARVLVVGDTAFEAEPIRAACTARGFDWIVPANPERVLAGPKPRPKVSQFSKTFAADSLTPIELCPGLTAWWRHQRGSLAKAWRGKYARRYWARTEILDVHHVGLVAVVFSTTIPPQAGQAVVVQKILLSNLQHWDSVRLVSAYAARWQIEQFFKEMKSGLGMDHYQVRDFVKVEGWVQVCCVAFCYLEYYRLRQQAASEHKEWWFRQRVWGLMCQVRQDLEEADLARLAQEMATAEGRRWLQERLRKAVPLEQRRP